MPFREKQAVGGAGKVVCVCREMEIDRQTDRQID